MNSFIANLVDEEFVQTYFFGQLPLSTLTPTYLFVLVRGGYRRASSISELSDNLTVTQQNLTVTKPRY
jgi:hypothetical protein